MWTEARSAFHINNQHQHINELFLFHETCVSGFSSLRLLHRTQKIGIHFVHNVLASNDFRKFDLQLILVRSCQVIFCCRRQHTVRRVSMSEDLVFTMECTYWNDLSCLNLESAVSSICRCLPTPRVSCVTQKPISTTTIISTKKLFNYRQCNVNSKAALSWTPHSLVNMNIFSIVRAISTLDMQNLQPTMGFCRKRNWIRGQGTTCTRLPSS